MQIHLFDPASKASLPTASTPQGRARAGTSDAQDAVEAIVKTSQQHVLEARALLAELHTDTVLLVETISAQLSDVLLEAERHYILHLTESEMLTQQEAHRLMKVRVVGMGGLPGALGLAERCCCCVACF